MKPIATMTLEIFDISYAPTDGTHVLIPTQEGTKIGAFLMDRWFYTPATSDTEFNVAIPVEPQPSVFAYTPDVSPPEPETEGDYFEDETGLH